MQKASENKYLIGDVSKICHIPKKTLRYYDSINLIKPKHVVQSTGYRYYNDDNLYDIMILKYFKQMGYSLEEIKYGLKNKDFTPVLSSLNNKIADLEEEKRLIESRILAAIEWKSIIEEAKEVKDKSDIGVSIKEIEVKEYYCLEQEYKYDYKASIINIPWINSLEENNEEIEGAVIMKFASFHEKMNGDIKRATILQRGIKNKAKGLTKIKFGGKFYSVYHVGELSDLNVTYEKLKSYIKQKEGVENFQREVFERYILDYWSTQDEKSFVTEILVSAEK